ncbi:MAG: tetratricopeptide repeat protein [Candidatus Omnitrophota bacterium]
MILGRRFFSRRERAGLRTLGLILIGIGVGFVASGELRAQTPDESARFQEANEAYRNKRFEEAIKIYTELARAYPGQAAFQYNLGNAYYRKNALGEAIVSYERALVADPRHRDARENLRYVRSLLSYRVDDKRNWYLRMAEVLLGYVTSREVMLVTMAAFAVLMILWVFALFFRQQFAWGWKRQIAGVFLLLALMLLVGKHFETHIFQKAVILAKEAQVRYGPSETDQIAFRVGEGIRVYVVDEREGWSRINLVSGESGWVSNSAIEKVRSL